MFLPLTAYILGKKGESKTAIEWLAFCAAFENPNFLVYFNDWSVIATFIEATRAEMGDEKFNKLWESGKALEIRTIYEQVMEAFFREQ